MTGGIIQDKAAMQKNIRLEGRELVTIFGQGVVRIESSENLWAYITEKPPEHTKRLIERIQEIYAGNFGSRLDISDNSFIMEIWGHLYFEFFLLRNERLGRFLFPFGLYNRLVRSCEAIDCGEADIDGNRWLWDVLGLFVPLLSRIIPRSSPSSSPPPRPPGTPPSQEGKAF